MTTVSDIEDDHTREVAEAVAGLGLGDHVRATATGIDEYVEGEVKSTNEIRDEWGDTHTVRFDTGAGATVTLSVLCREYDDSEAKLGVRFPQNNFPSSKGEITDIEVDTDEPAATLEVPTETDARQLYHLLSTAFEEDEPRESEDETLWAELRAQLSNQL